MAVSRLIARPLLASMFVVGGYNALKNADALAARAKPVTDKLTEMAPDVPGTTPENLVRANAAVQLLAGAALATGRAPRLSALLLAGTLVPTTLGGHRFWEETDPAQKQNQTVHFFKNASMLGGLLIAAGDTEGRPGVAWRTKHAVAGVKDSAVAHLPG